jgi:hypothetical protein
MGVAAEAAEAKVAAGAEAIKKKGSGIASFKRRMRPQLKLLPGQENI